MIFVPFNLLIKTLSTNKNIQSQRVYLNYFFSLMYIRMSGKNINFDDKKNKKSEFYKNKKAFQIDDVDVNKILVSKKEPYGTKNAVKYFIGYNDNDVIRPLCVWLSQMTGYAKKFFENATMSFRAKDKRFLKKYNKIWEKVEELLKADFESKPVYGDDDKYIKTNIKIIFLKYANMCKKR